MLRSKRIPAIIRNAKLGPRETCFRAMGLLEAAGSKLFK
jgi:hypothetical protein